MIPEASGLDGPRDPHHQPNTVIVKVDQELDDLLAAIDSPYVR